MKRIQIVKNGTVTNQAELSALEADAWLARHLAKGTFGTDFEVIETDITAELAQAQTNVQALAYLAATDFLIIREMDNGVPCPQEIKDLRQAARDSIV